jgi:ABC-type transport system involved in multi-copper enzyme maturation permease subunit
MNARILKYELKRFTSLKIVWIFAPIFLVLNMLIVIGPVSDLEYFEFDGTIAGFFIFNTILGIGLLIPYMIGTLSQEFTNDSFRLATLAFPKRVNLILVKYLFSMVTSFVIFMTGFLFATLSVLFIASIKLEDVKFIDLFSAKTLFTYFSISIYFICVHAVLFALTLIVKNPLPAVIFNFTWVLIIQWILDFVIIALFFSDTYGDNYRGDGTKLFTALIPIYGLSRFIAVSSLFELSGYGFQILSIVTSIIFAGLCLGLSVFLFNKRDI